MFGVIGFSHAKGARSTQNIVIAFVFLVLALIGLQVTGLVRFTPLATLALAPGIAVLDVIILRIAVGLFQREAIVVKWH